MCRFPVLAVLALCACAASPSPPPASATPAADERVEIRLTVQQLDLIGYALTDCVCKVRDALSLIGDIKAQYDAQRAAKPAEDKRP